MTPYERGFEDGVWSVMDWTTSNVTTLTFTDFITFSIPLYLCLYLFYKWGTRHDNRS